MIEIPKCIPYWDPITCSSFMIGTSNAQTARMKALSEALETMSSSYEKYKNKVIKVMNMEHKIWKSKRVKKIRRMQVGGRSCK